MGLVMRSCAVASLVALVGSSAAAAPAGIQVRVSGEEGRCVGSAELRGRAAELPSWADVEGEATIDVAIGARAGGGFAAVISLRRGTLPIGEKRVETANPDCHDIDAAVLVVIDALLVIAAGTDAGDAMQPAAPANPSPRAAPPASRATKPPPERAHGRDGTRRDPPSVTVGAAYAVGIVPGAAALVRAEGRFAVAGPWAIRVGVGLTPWSTSRELQAAEVRFRSFSARGQGCLDLAGERRGYLDACLGVDGGVTTTTQSGTRNDHDTTRPALWPLASLTLGLEIVGPAVAELSTAFGPALFKDTYELVNRAGQPRNVYETAPVRWEAGLALGAVFR